MIGGNGKETILGQALQGGVKGGAGIAAVLEQFPCRDMGVVIKAEQYLEFAGDAFHLGGILNIPQRFV